MSRLVLAPPKPGEALSESRRISAACPWLYLASATANGTYRLACSRCGSEWPVEAPSAAALQRAIQRMEERHKEGADGMCVPKRPGRKPMRDRNVTAPRLF